MGTPKTTQNHPHTGSKTGRIQHSPSTTSPTPKTTQNHPHTGSKTGRIQHSPSTTSPTPKTTHTLAQKQAGSSTHPLPHPLHPKPPTHWLKNRQDPALNLHHIPYTQNHPHTGSKTGRIQRSTSTTSPTPKNSPKVTQSQKS